MTFKHDFCVEAPSHKGIIAKPPCQFLVPNAVCAVSTGEKRPPFWAPQRISPIAQKFIFKSTQSEV